MKPNYIVIAAIGLVALIIYEKVRENNLKQDILSMESATSIEQLAAMINALVNPINHHTKNEIIKLNQAFERIARQKGWM